MSFRGAFKVLGVVILLNLNSYEAKRVKFETDQRPAGTRSRHHWNNRLHPQLFNLYNNLLNRPFINQHLYKIINKKRHEKPFVDFTRDEPVKKPSNSDNVKFSDDYIDIGELARYANNLADGNEVPYEVKLAENKLSVDIPDNTYQVLKILNRIARRMTNQQRSEAGQTDTGESSDSDSDKADKEKTRPIMGKNTRTRHIPKRFQVINNNSGETKSESGSDDDVSDVSAENVNKIKVSNDSESKSKEESSNEVMYIQSPTRHFKTSDVEWRRRLKHFLPKRVHWNEKDFQNLRNYWIAGPRGRYPAQYKTPY